MVTWSLLFYPDWLLWLKLLSKMNLLLYWCSGNQSLGFKLEANILTKMVDFTLKCYLTSSLTPQAFIFWFICLFYHFPFQFGGCTLFSFFNKFGLLQKKIQGMGKQSYLLESLMALFFKALLGERRIRDQYCKIQLTIWIIFIY